MGGGEFMKNPLAILFMLIAAVAAAHSARGEELVMFGSLPDPGKEWSVLKKGSRADDSFYSFSWVVFTNSRTGDMLSFVADRLEYTYVYEDESQAARAARPHRLAHGYVLAFGDLVVFVQHTSDHAITTELANDMALSLVLIGSTRTPAGEPVKKTQPSKGE
jgi:hypothetical protein